MSGRPFAKAWLAKSGNDAVDGSSTGHVSAMDLGAARAPTICGLWALGTFLACPEL
jgi:hypothetical protein